jgi:adenylate cyclase
MSNENFFAELKRRNVYKVVITYAVIAWLLIEVAAMILASNGAPPWVLTAFVIFLALGLFVVAMISWSFEATPEGLKRTKDVPPDAVLPTWSRRKHTTFLLVVAALAGALLAYQFLRGRPPIPPPDGQPRSEAPAQP